MMNGDDTPLSPSATNPPPPPPPPANPFSNEPYAAVSATEMRSLPRPTGGGAPPPAGGGGGGGANPFALYEGDDAGAASGVWEAPAAGRRSAPRPWQLRYYAPAFDVTTADVARRLACACVPVTPLLGWGGVGEVDAAGGNGLPDLYGAVWVTTTLVLSLSMASAASAFFRGVFRQQEVTGLTHGGVDVRVLASAAGLVYPYVFLAPLVWHAVRCLVPSGGGGGGGALPLDGGPRAGGGLVDGEEEGRPGVTVGVCVYGYSMTPVVIAAWVCTVPVRAVQLGAMGAAFALSAWFVMFNPRQREVVLVVGRPQYEGGGRRGCTAPDGAAHSLRARPACARRQADGTAGGGSRPRLRACFHAMPSYAQRQLADHEAVTPFPLPEA